MFFSIAGFLRAKIFREKTSTFFKFSAAIAVSFGIVDLFLKDSFLFKYEAAVTNFITGLFFASTIFADKPLIQEFYERRKGPQHSVKPELVRFFRGFTLVWVIYFFVKAAFYVWVAKRYSIEKGMVIRGLVGNISLGLMIAVSFGFGPILYRLSKRMGLLKAS